MKGTLALWYEPAPDAPANGPGVEVELHLNLWRDLPSGVNFLDVGMLFACSRGMSRFYLYVPAALVRAQVEDLSGILRSTANAVFNDVVRFGEEGDRHYTITRSRQVDTVYALGTGDLELVADGDAVFGSGTRLTFQSALVDRMGDGRGRSYLRFRIHLTGGAKNTFSSEIPARDRVFASSAGLLEVTEFRLNERRSYPVSISSRDLPGQFRIRQIHYFLIRDLEHQLISQHAPFEKVRRMEAQLWLKYLASAFPEGADRLTAHVAERLVIYHWRHKSNEEGGIKDFVAFASFRTTSTNLARYLPVIVLLGAAGSILAAFGIDYIRFAIRPGPHRPRHWPTGLDADWSLLIVCAFLLTLIVVSPVIKSLARSTWSAVSGAARTARAKMALRKRMRER